MPVKSCLDYSLRLLMQEKELATLLVLEALVVELELLQIFWKRFKEGRVYLIYKTNVLGIFLPFQATRERYFREQWLVRTMR